MQHHHTHKTGAKNLMFARTEKEKMPVTKTPVAKNNRRGEKDSGRKEAISKTFAVDYIGGARLFGCIATLSLSCTAKGWQRHAFVSVLDLDLQS